MLALKDGQGNQAAFYCCAPRSLTSLEWDDEWRVPWALLCQVASSNIQPKAFGVACTLCTCHPG